MTKRIAVSDSQPVVGLYGSGALLCGVRRALADMPYHVMSTLHDLEEHSDRCALVVHCADRWQMSSQLAVNARAIAHQTPLLQAYAEFGTGIVGPFVLPGEPGCVHCVYLRRMALAANADDITRLAKRVEASETPAATHPWLVALTVDALAQLVRREITAYLLSPHDVSTYHALIHLDLATWHLMRHRFLPDPHCPDCGQQVPDTAQAATIALESRPKPMPWSYRIRDLAPQDTQLRERYVDQHVGLINVLAQDVRVPWAVAIAQAGFNFEGTWQRQLPGTGRTLSYQKSRVVAIAEALERYGGHYPKGKRVAVRASYRQLGDQALDPTTLGLHTPQQYDQPQFGFVPYHPDLVFNWVWGYSFQRQRSILVPQRYAYYGLPLDLHAQDNPAFVYEVSNGCALGTCLEEAILYGLLEVIERDAFLMTWYARLPLPRIDISSVPDPTVRLLVEHIEYTTGYTLYAYDATLDHAVPCTWLMVVDEQERELAPKILCGAAAHPRARETFARGLLELGTALSMVGRQFEGQRERAIQMLNNPFEVREMPDHSLLYCLPEAFDRLAFLPRTPTPYTFQDAFGDNDRQPETGDLRDDVSTIISHYLGRGFDVVVVDQTAPEHAAGGFHCAKVIVPGMLPMTFGHKYRRCAGFPRLRDLPLSLGFREYPLEDDEVNPHPHPFP